MSLLDVSAAPIIEHGQITAIKRVQEIPEGHLRDLDAIRSAPNRNSEFRLVASVPVALVEHWKAQGFDMMTASAKEIVARLRTENLEAFITSNV